MLLHQIGCEMEGFLMSIITDGTLLNFQGELLFSFTIILILNITVCHLEHFCLSFNQQLIYT